MDYRPSIGRYFDDAPRPTIGQLLVVYWSSVIGEHVAVSDAHARTKNVTRQDAIAKKGMLSCLILSSLDS